MYRHFLKRFFDIVLSMLAILLLSPVLLVFTVLGAIKMHGNPFFVQPRPGKDEKVFFMLKFRTMTGERDHAGNLLPDEQRVTAYGRFLRARSIDELPELFNIFNGDMSFVGPRPQLVRDMVFMTPEQRKRHSVRPGLTGLAQVSGRNALVWDRKLQVDLEYIRALSFALDVKIVFRTAKLIVFGGEGSEATDLTDDYGDYLLKHGSISKEEYDFRMAEARELLEV